MEKRIIEVTGLSKSFGSVDAVKGIDFYVEAGKLFAFLGPNGAGKSTTIDMLCTLLRPDAGRVLIDGHLLGREDDEIRRKIGVVFQDSVLDPLLSVRENLLVRARLYGSDRQDYEANVRRAIETAGVEPFLNRRYGKLSGGQRRRTDIARALVNTPQILFLDEPTTGLDPQTKKNVWETIRALQKENNMTVFLTTHYMEEAAGADYIMIIDNGEIVARGTPDALREQYSSDLLRLRASDRAALQTRLTELGIAYTCTNGICNVPLPGTMAAIRILNSVEPYIESFEVQHGTMDDVFLNITGKELRDHD